MRLLILCVLLVAPGLALQTDPLVVTLLGTGTPNPRPDRMGPSTLIEAGGLRLVFDAGRGTTIRLEQAGIRTGAISAVFLTHLHSDHSNGLPDLWLTGWLPPFGARTTPLRVIGPTGTRAMMEALAAAFREDIRMRTTEEQLPASGIASAATDITGDATVFDEQGVRVTAFLVDHGGELKPAFGYRVDYRGRSVVISGDTRYSPNVLRHARGADVVLHEVAMAPPEIQDQPAVRFVLAHHTSPEEVGRLFAQANPRLGVLTHFAFPPNRQGRDLTPEDAVTVVGRHFAGRVVAGEDLMRIGVGPTIDVRRGR